MKITYERLNQIIEEEVVKFKQLNEVIVKADIDTSTLEGSKTILLNAIKQAQDVTQLKALVSSALANVGR
jgi:citrate lyase beta subunit